MQDSCPGETGCGLQDPGQHTAVTRATEILLFLLWESPCLIYCIMLVSSPPKVKGDMSEDGAALMHGTGPYKKMF